MTHWNLEWASARSWLGQCDYRRKRIRLSRELLRSDVSEAEALDTIRHELAHAMTPGDGHGADWHAACRITGARPERLATGVETRYIWATVCQRCVAITRRTIRRRAARSIARRTCKRCGGRLAQQRTV